MIRPPSLHITLLAFAAAGGVLLAFASHQLSTAGTIAPSGLNSTCDSALLAYPIPDNSQDGTVAFQSFDQPGKITDLDICLDISHTWVGDLVVTLEHYQTGTTVTLLDRPGTGAGGCSSDDISVVLNDEAGTPAEDVCAANPPAIGGTLKPNDALSAFDGEALYGTWYLRVYDQAAGDVGTLDRWALIPQTFVATPQPIVGNPVIAFDSTRDGNQDIFVMDEDGGNPTNITLGEPYESAPDWSPDGTRIVFVREGNVWVMNFDGTGQTQLTTGKNDYEPDWSPDGSKIAFERLLYVDDKYQDIWVMDADGTNQMQITDRVGSDTAPQWSPDGTRILYTSSASLRTIDPDGQNDQVVLGSSPDDFSPHWSPDGTTIAVSRGPGLDRDIYTIGPNGVPVTMLTDTLDNFMPNWSIDGSKILFSSSRDGNSNIFVMNTDGSHQTNLTNIDAEDYRPDWRPGAAATPTPTPTASPTLTPTPTPTPAPTPAQIAALWGDDDCDGDSDSVDALKNLQHLAAIPYTQTDPCWPLGEVVGVSTAGSDNHPWGDVDCDGDVDSVDALQLLRSLAALPVVQDPPCPQVGQQVLIAP